MDLDWLKEAWRRVRKDAAPGVDGQTADEYAADLEGNLQSLLDRAKSGRYRAPAVRRVFIAKSDGKEQRPLGIPTLEDKILQRAVLMLVEPVFEEDFLGCSYGFRPKRSAHDALAKIRDCVMEMGGATVIDLDLRKYFDSIDRKLLLEMFHQRVCDGVLNRLIAKWLHAGIMEDGNIHYPDAGTPQGGVISPLLANLFLHHVLDQWFEAEITPRLKGRAQLIRYADDAVLIFAREEDARRVMAVLAKRVQRFGLELHPEKTRLVNFRRPRPPQGSQPALRSDSFQFLGFTHYWGLSRKKRRVVKRKTAKDRLQRAIQSIDRWCRNARHLPVRFQHATLNRKLRGHNNYYGINGNWHCLEQVRRAAVRSWKKWLNRRSQNRHINWERMNEILRVYPVARPQIYHSRG
jgi:group II intron reverse transcriptase/maturase